MKWPKAVMTRGRDKARSSDSSKEVKKALDKSVRLMYNNPVGAIPT